MTVIFSEKEWHDCTVGQIFNYYVEEATKCGGIFHVPHISRKGRDAVVDYIRFPAGHRIEVILAKLVEMADSIARGSLKESSSASHNVTIK